MSKFTDLLNAPLPSALQNVEENAADTNEEAVTTESVDIENNDDTVKEDTIDTDVIDDSTDAPVDDSAAEALEGSDSDDDDDDDIDDDDDKEFDPDDLSDEELAELDKELGDETLNDVVGSDGEISLSPEEEIEADDMMSTAATTMLVKDELNAEERAEFLKDEDQVNIAINEGFMSDIDADVMSYECGLITEAKYSNKMIIRLDAASKKKQLYALGVNVSAAAHNDPDYRKYKKVMKLKKILRMKLEKKYHSEAMKRMKVYYARLSKSKSPILAKLGKAGK